MKRVVAIGSKLIQTASKVEKHLQERMEVKREREREREVVRKKPTQNSNKHDMLFIKRKSSIFI